MFHIMNECPKYKIFVNFHNILEKYTLDEYSYYLYIENKFKNLVTLVSVESINVRTF